MPTSAQIERPAICCAERRLLRLIAFSLVRFLQLVQDEAAKKSWEMKLFDAASISLISHLT